MNASPKAIEQVAKLCHEVNRSWCEIQGDSSQSPWEESPAWQKESAIKGVLFHIENPDAGADSSHKSWMKEKVDNGWEWGEQKDPTSKPPTHPCIVPFEDLPWEQQIKDHLFKMVVHTVLGLEPNNKENTSMNTKVTDTDFNPSGNPEIHEIKTKANELAQIIGLLPPGRRRSHALTQLEDAAMWAVKAAAVGDA